MKRERHPSEPVGNHCLTPQPVIIATQLPVFPSVGGDDSEEEEEVDSNNEDGGSQKSERTDKDDEAGEGRSHEHLAAVPQMLICQLLTSCGSQYCKLHVGMKIHKS